MKKLDRALLEQVKLGFVPEPGGGGEPVAGASPMTAGMVAPMGGDPMAGGAPPPGGDPAAMGGDPAAMGMPPPGLDPAMAGMLGGGGAAPGGEMQGNSTITITIDDLIKLFKVFQKNSGQPGAAPAAAPAPAPAAPQGDPRLDKLITLLEGALGGGEPAAGGAR